ncbi:MAG: hypothetical protein FWD46_01010 [Cystobacterineae bacterium]|nr:hypothetical protein [Cystobacterineae bacterium]
MNSHYQQPFEELIAWAIPDSSNVDLLEAKAQYMKVVGDFHEEDRFFENHMTCFLEYFLFDRPRPADNKTPAVAFYEHLLRTAPDKAEEARCFTETVHGLFEVGKCKAHRIVLRELFSEADFEVTERRSILGLNRKDILEARLIPFDGNLLFSQSFLMHPSEVADAIRKEAKRWKKEEPQRHPRELTWECARRLLRLGRYQQIDPQRVYDFELTGN